MDEDDDTSDWIELFNAGSDSINLSGYMLTDESDEPGQWVFPSVVIHPDSFLLIWASGKNRQDSSYLHTNFKLNASGEYVGLYAPDSSLMDGVSFGSQRADISYGRLPDGSNHFTTFYHPTPGSPNQSEITLSFSPLQGVYQGDITVTLQTNCDTCKIYYTLDGSEPNSGDVLYSDAVTLTVPTVIRARVFKNGTAMTNIEARTYIVNDDPQLPVLSVMTNPEHLWSKSTGIYHNYDSTGIGWERPAHLTLIEDDETKFSLPAGIRIHGEFSRRFQKKNFRVFFRTEYGESKLNYPVFNDREYTRYDRLVLYAPSDDQVTGDTVYFTYIADVLMQDLWFNSDGIVSLFRPVSLYINGKYWGIYWIREFINKHYIETNFGITDMDLHRIQKGKVVPEVREGDRWYWMDTLFFFEVNDLRSNINYDTIKTNYFEIENLIDYHLFCIYGATLDWPHNNVDRFRDRVGEDPRWRFIMWDHNMAWRKAHPAHQTLIWATRDEVMTNILPTDYENLLSSTFILRSLMINNDFRTTFINRFADLINTVLLPDTIEMHMDALAGSIRPEMNRELARWGYQIDTLKWESNLDRMRSFVHKRPGYMRQQIMDYFHIKDTVRVTILPSVGNGEVTINTVTPQELPWEGIYFSQIHMELKAIPAAGYMFYQWSDTTLPSQSEVTVSLEEDRSFQAVFYETLQIQDVLIESITDSSADISWNTNVPAIGWIAYGLSDTLGYETETEAEAVQAHHFALEALEPDTLYYFQILCTDSIGQHVEGALLTFRTLGGATDVSSRDNVIPKAFGLSPNYPNPFNGITQWEVALPEPGNLHAAVYNVSGQRVTLLYDGYHTAGFKRMDWNGRNTMGEMLVSGVYIIRVVFEGQSGGREQATVRMVMIR